MISQIEKQLVKTVVKAVVFLLFSFCFTVFIGFVGIVSLITAYDVGLIQRGSPAGLLFAFVIVTLPILTAIVLIMGENRAV